MQYKKLYPLFIPFLSLLFLIIFKRSDTLILWMLAYLFSLFALFIFSLILVVSERTRKEGFMMLLGIGILLVIGLGVCSSVL